MVSIPLEEEIFVNNPLTFLASMGGGFDTYSGPSLGVKDHIRFGDQLFKPWSGEFFKLNADLGAWHRLA